MNVHQEDQSSDAWLVLSREFDEIIVIAFYAESKF